MGITIIGVPGDPFNPPSLDLLVPPMTPEQQEEYGACLEYWEDLVFTGSLDAGYDSFSQTVNTYVHTSAGTFYNQTQWTVENNGIVTDGYRFDFVGSGNQPIQMKVEFSRAYDFSGVNETWVYKTTYAGENVSVILTLDQWGAEMYESDRNGTRHTGTRFYNPYN